MNRRAIEIVTAVLLGFASISTAVGVHQASALSAESAGYAYVAQQARDRALTRSLTSQLVLTDDGDKLASALSIDSELAFFPERTAELQLRQQAIVRSASAPFEAAWTAWATSNYAAELNPMTSAAYESALYSGPHAQTYVQGVAEGAAERTAARAGRMVVASVAFAAALLLLGVSGAVAASRPSLVLALGGAAFSLVGAAVIVVDLF